MKLLFNQNRNDQVVDCVVVVAGVVGVGAADQLDGATSRRRREGSGQGGLRLGARRKSDPGQAQTRTAGSLSEGKNEIERVSER